MAYYPEIERPCPNADRLDEIMDGDLCRACNHIVVDLTALNDDDRRVFVAGLNGGAACITYKRPRKAAVVAAAMAVAVAALPAAAQEAPAAPDAAFFQAAEDEIELDVFVGGIGLRNDGKSGSGEQIEDAAIPDIPVVYEGEPAA